MKCVNPPLHFPEQTTDQSILTRPQFCQTPQLAIDKSSGSKFSCPLFGGQSHGKLHQKQRILTLNQPTLNPTITPTPTKPSFSTGLQLLQSQELRNTDVEKVGGKSASLGEMISQLSDVGVPVPGGVT